MELAQPLIPSAFHGERSARRAMAFRFWNARYSHPAPFFAAVILLVLLLVAAASALAAAAFPHAAYADDIWSIIKNPGEWFSNTMNSFMNDFWGTLMQGFFEAGGYFLGLVQVDQLSSGFDQLFKNSGAWGLVKSVQGTILNGLAYGVLAIVFLVQTVKIANRIDGNQAVPGLKDVIFLLLFFVIAKYIIDNSLMFCEAVYNIIPAVIKLIDPEATYMHIDMTFLKIQPDVSLSRELNGFSGVLASAVFMVVCMISSVVTYVVVFARNIQLYLYAILAPIPLTLLFADETRQQAMGFIKNFLALCFAGLIIVILCKLFPMMIQSCLQQQLVVLGLVQSLAVMIVFIISLVKSGSWARDIFGG